MLISKFSEGCVEQVYDTDKQAWVSQKFVAGGECTYATNGDEINSQDFENHVAGRVEPYLPFDMVQPS